ncbi:GIY-YIG nuclease family protein [cf. Phormidesmis sp. LEGE 11477]|uniref:GIY-YIG nuclease family protein n=1 Tax=cf. Phormidesmis sp. LEGE 11477 TaxID=1828680 RepID=UPI00187E915B|nr:GIY-YIG nuclease family protein [cf. Phormidesmis sp. LEGE 11477]MBE9059436.1 GIY-YIG nuclease family protein [cf. Phormidesmis sp. LEGE 11477]
MSEDRQAFLLSDSAMQAASYSTYKNFQPPTKVGFTELKAWKKRVIGFQTQLATIEQQGRLFGDGSADHSNGDSSDSEATLSSLVGTIDPFALRQQNTEFWRWQFDDVGVAAMYFVIDYASTAHSRPVVLYIGETIKSNQRWKGEHDCKRYLLNYRQAHYDHGLSSELGIAFWPKAPSDRTARQQLESALIRHWRSPFNKENWRFWNTPFVESLL